MTDRVAKSHEQIIDERNTPTAVTFDHEHIWIKFADERVLGVPLAWYPELAQATTEQQGRYVATPLSIRWREFQVMIDIPAALHATYGVLSFTVATPDW